jgi:hypothetical protein
MAIATFVSKEKHPLEAGMNRICLIAAVTVLGFGSAAAEEPTGRPEAGQSAAPMVPPASGTTSSELSRSGGVIKPPAGIDPEIKQTPPETGAKMPVIPPPGTPGGNPAVKPK